MCTLVYLKSILDKITKKYYFGHYFATFYLEIHPFMISVKTNHSYVKLEIEINLETYFVIFVDFFLYTNNIFPYQKKCCNNCSSKAGQWP